jgi:hypothetical protein
MTMSADYSYTNLHIVPWDVYNAGQIVANSAQDISDALVVIADTLSKLKLGWVGTSAAEAQSFGDEWTMAMTNLFGTSGDPWLGALGQVIVTLYTAAGNYTASEEAITSMFGSLATSLSAHAASSGGPAPAVGPGDLVIDPTLSAVGEVGWTGAS